MQTLWRPASVRLFLLAGMSLLMAGAQAAAQSVQKPVADDPEANLVSELVVTARPPGPSWWTVEKGASKLYILGLPPTPLPKGLAWDRSLFQRRLKSATAFLPVPAIMTSVDVGAFQGLGLLTRMAPGMGWTNGDVEKAMPPPLSTRFAADRTALGYPVSRYATPAPILAAFKIRQDYLDRSGMTDDLVQDLIAEASKAKVRVEKRLRIVSPPLKFEDFSLTRPPVQDCFNAVLSQVETNPEVYRAAARAWAAGRLTEALAAPRDPQTLCTARIYSGAFLRQAWTAEIDDLARRLEKPGVTIAVLGVRSLLAEDGVIAGLRARGYAVTGPEADAAR